MPKLYTTISECKHFYSKVFEKMAADPRPQDLRSYKKQGDFAAL